MYDLDATSDTPRDTAVSATPEQVDELRTAFADGSTFMADDVAIPAATLVGLLTATDVAQPGIPALRLHSARITGSLALAGAELTALVEFADCTFDRTPDLSTASVPGVSWTRCTLPGLLATNLRVRGDLALTGCTVSGVLQLTDAEIGGSLRCDNSTILGPGEHAVRAERIAVSGALSARWLTAVGELRLPGARIEGDVDLEHATLTHTGADALDATGLRAGGSLRCDGGFSADGRVVLAGAVVGGDTVFSGATLRAAPSTGDGPVLVLPRGRADTSASLVADRLVTHGNVAFDAGFTATGTVRLPQAHIDGYLRLSGAVLGDPNPATVDNGDVERVVVALLADGIEVGGDVEARGRGTGLDRDRDALTAHGQVRLPDGRVRGSASLSGARLLTPGGDALFADRLHVGGSLFLRRIVARGTVRLQNADIGSTLDCQAARLTDPRVRPDGSTRPSLDVRASTVGKDVLCIAGFTATGGVRLRRTEVAKSINMDGSVLGGDGPGVKALNAYGLTAQELRLRFAEPPRGHVRLARAVVASVYDDATLWAVDGALDLEDFRYDSLSAQPDVDVHTRLRWLVKAAPRYDPDPYDQLAAIYRDDGRDERADRVLLAKERRRHGEMRLPGQIWGRLQDVTVGYGYRPWLAVVWLLAFWLAGSLWFAVHELPKLDSGQNPAWNPVLYAADLLIPVVNLGQDNLWRTAGASAWVAGVLTLAGWTLVSTAAAGAARILRR